VEAEVRIGNLRATIRPEGIDGQSSYNIKLERMDQKSGAWSCLCSLCSDDILITKQVLERAQRRINELKQAASEIK
jgi:hypothetical protein